LTKQKKFLKKREHRFKINFCFLASFWYVI